jgi:uncharacterized surface protein with fasciclin (FAS1) repeats
MSHTMLRGGRTRAAVMLLLAAALVLTAAACGGSADTPGASSSPEGPGGMPTNTPTPTVTPQVVPSVSASTLLDAVRAGDLKGFAAAVAAAGLDSLLKKDIPYTILAPNDEAFKSLGLEQLIKDVPRAKTVMDYHVIPVEDLKVSEIQDGYEAATYLGYPVRFTVKDGAVMVNDANVVKVIEGPSWSIFVIDKVLQPPSSITPEATESTAP